MAVEPSVCEPSARSGSVLQGDSVCAHRAPCDSFAEGPSVRAGTTAYYTRPSFSAPAQAMVTPQAVVGPPVAPSPSFAAGPPLKLEGPYRAKPEDPIDVEVAEYFRENPQVFYKNRGFTRISAGSYYLHGREITVERQSPDTVGQLMGQKSQLVVRDGPLTQPLADYLANEDSSAEYNGSVFKAKNNLQTIPQDCRMTFHDTGAGYSRLEAMKVAKEQAVAREKAAAMLNKGQLSSGELKTQYEKKIDIKLGKNRTPEKAISFVHSPAGSPAHAPMPASGFASPGQRLNFGGAARSPRGSLRSPLGTPQAHRQTRPPRAGGA